MATVEEKNLLATKLLPLVARNAATLRNEEITGFLSMTGHLYRHELMVIGRAVNGWVEGIHPRNLCNPFSSSAQYAEKIFDSAIGDQNRCPMLWVTDLWGADRAGKKYNTAKSAFWRVIREVVSQLNIANINNDNWPSHLVWSNLYKIAPAKGGNPGDKLCDLQLDDCVELLRMEITNYQPKRILFLIGIDQWAPALNFITKLHGTIGARNPAFTEVQAYGNATNKTCAHQYRFVMARHPMTRPEVTWVNEVLQVL